MNVIEGLEFKLTYFKATVQHFSHYAIETPPHKYMLFHWGISFFY